MISVYLLSVIFSVTFLYIVIDLVRRKKLKEQYSLLWMMVSIILLVFSLKRQNLEWVANVLSIKYAPALLFLFGLIFCFILILHLTIVISNQSERLIKLTQEFSLLNSDNYEIRDKDPS